MNLGVAILAISTLGYISNWLNWRYLNFGIVRMLYYIGAFVHETSHALLCLVTGATIREYRVFSTQPHVTHLKPRLPLLGTPLIALAPIPGGLAFLFLVNKYLLSSAVTIPHLTGLASIPHEIVAFIAQLNPIHWQSWVIFLLFFNLGAMVGPSFQDLKNMWPLLILLLFVNIAPIFSFFSFAMILILINIVLQLALILILKLFSFMTSS